MDRITKNILLILSKPDLKPSRFMEVYKRNSCNIEKTINYFNKNYRFEIQHFKLQENELPVSAKQVDTLLNYLSEEKIGLINISQNDYPELLKQIHMPPPLFFYKGEKIKEYGLSIAVVGTRKYTSYGKDAAIYIAGRLSEIGITVVSGMAAGIDYWAQKEAIKYKGGSIGVLGCGINI
ncbi:MAG: hypothetical protein FJW61_07470, partial [Actinobacteria bacterium]|nr:hypothetical protein [Actinomycetota bacterium]